MVKDGNYVAIFHSVHRVMEAERLVKEKRLAIKVIPAPRALAADCGLAITFGEAIRGEVEAVLAPAGLLPGELYRKKGDNFEKIEGEQ